MARRGGGGRRSSYVVDRGERDLRVRERCLRGVDANGVGMDAGGVEEAMWSEAVGSGGLGLGPGGGVVPSGVGVGEGPGG